MNNEYRKLLSKLIWKQTDFNNEQPQKVVQSDINEFKSFIDKNSSELSIDNDIEFLEDILKPQGITFSHIHELPVLTNLVASFGVPAHLANNQEEGPPQTILSRILKGISVLTHVRFWVFIYAILYAYEILFTSMMKDKKAVKVTKRAFARVRYFISTVILLCTIYKAATFDDPTAIGRWTEFFWREVFPDWVNLGNEFHGDDGRNPDEGVFTVDMFEIPEYTAQGFSEYVPQMSNVLMALLSFSIGYKVKDRFSQSILTMLKTTPVSSNNMVLGIVNTVNGIGDLLKSMGSEEVHKYFHIDMVSTEYIKNFLDKSTDFVTNTAAGEVLGSLYYSEINTELIREGEELVRTLDKNSYDFRVVTDAILQLRKAAQVVKSNRSSLNGQRVEPVGVMIKGAPGCKKGIFAKRLATILISHTLPEPWMDDFKRDEKDFIYSAPNDKFYERYTYKAWVTMLDDLFQIRDTVGDPESEAVRVIKMINSAEYPLPMADIKMKNSTFFRSQFVIATSNLTDYKQLESIRDYNAVQRRFHVDIKLSVSSKYCYGDGKTNDNFLPRTTVTVDEEDLEGSVVPNDFWVIERRIVTSDSVGSYVRVSFSELLKTCIRIHKDHVTHYYVNHAIELDYAKQLNEEIDILSRGKYSKMAYRTFRAQGDNMVGAYEQTGGLSFKEIFQEFDGDSKQRLFMLYLTMVSSFGIRRYFLNPIEDITKHIEMLNLPSRRALLSNTVDLELFVIKLRNSYEHYLDNNRDPITGDSLRVDDDSEEQLGILRKSFDSIYNFFNDNKIVIMFGLPVILGSIYLLNNFFSKVLPTEMATPHSFDLSRDRSKVGKTRTGLIKYKDGVRLKPQAPKMTCPIERFVFPPVDTSLLGPIDNNNDVLSHIINKYHFIVNVLRIRDGEPHVVRLGHALNVVGKLFTMPLHFIYLLHDIHSHPSYEGANVSFTTVTNSTVFICSLEDILSSFKASDDSCNNDICLIEVPGAHATSKGMIKHMLTAEDIKKLMKMNVFRSRVTGTYQSLESRTNSFRSTSVESKFNYDALIEATWEAAKQDPLYLLEIGICYDGDFNPGECGSMLTVDGRNFENRTVLGMHVAGAQGYGISNILIQDNMLKLVNALYPNSIIFLDEEEVPHIKQRPLQAQGLMEPFADLLPGYAPSTVNTTEIRRSKLFGLLPEPFSKVDTYPARLKNFTRDGVTFEPVKDALYKYKKPPICYAKGFVAKAVASYETLISHNLTTTFEQRRVVTLKEALHSFDNVRGISASTSAGYPMTLNKEENLKRSYYKAVYSEDNVNVEIYYQRIAKLVDDSILKYSQDIRPAWLYKGFAKDELRPLEKVVTNPSTRLCSGSPFIMLVLYRMYFGSFMSAYFEANIKVGSAIGLNPYKDWDNMARTLLKFNVTNSEETIGAGDYKGFDTTERPELLWEIVEMINRWYGENNPNNRLRLQLWAEIINSKHVFDSELFQWVTGMPSGNPLTAIINTIYNNITFRIAWQVANLDPSLFNDNVSLVCLGDDNIFSVSQTYRAVFNEILMPSYMDSCGMVYTTELKETATSNFRSIYNTEFLKRSFRKDLPTGKWVAPMRIKALFDPLNWTKKGIMGDQINVDQVTSTIMELSLHGKKVFDHYAMPLHCLRLKHYPHGKPSKELSINYNYVFAMVSETDFLY